MIYYLSVVRCASGLALSRQGCQ